MKKKKTTKKNKTTSKQKRKSIQELSAEYKDVTSLNTEEEYELQKQILESAEYYAVSKELVRKVGWIMAGYITMYLSMSRYAYEHAPANKGWFYLTKERFMDLGKIANRTLIKMKKDLIKSGLIEVKRRGAPSKEWYKINGLKLLELVTPLEENQTEQAKDKKTTTEILGETTTIEEAYSKHTQKEIEKRTNSHVAVHLCSRVKNSTAIYKHKKTEYKSKISFDIPSSSSNEEGKGSIKNICGRAKAKAALPPSNISNHLSDIISYWNTLPNVTKHRLDQETKTIKSICQMLTALMQGRPIVYTKSLSPNKELKEFFQSQSLHTRFLRKQWTVQEIKDNLRDAVSLRNETGVNTRIGLPVILWNSFASRDKDGNKTAFSWFYYAVALQDTPPAFKDAAIRMAESLGNAHDRPITKWAHELYNFTKTMGDRESEVVPLLKWYLTHRKDLYMPVVRDMQEFVRKYEQILETRTRQRRYMGNRLFVDDPASVVLYDGKGRVIKSAPARTTLEPIKLYNGRGQLIN